MSESVVTASSCTRRKKLNPETSKLQAIIHNNDEKKILCYFFIIESIIIDRLTTARQQDNKDNPTCIIIIMSSIKKKGSYANADGNVKSGSRCINVWAIPPDVYEVTSRDERVELLESLAQTTDDGPFPANSLTTPAPISLLEETVVLLTLGIQLGGPLMWVFSMVTLVFVGSWTQLTTATAMSAALAYHPMPSHVYSKQNVINSWWCRALYKYFTYRFVWTGDSHELIQNAKPWIGAGVSQVMESVDSSGVC